MIAPSNPIKLFLCNHEEDNGLKKTCVDHLLCLPNLSIWDPSMTLAGQNIETETDIRLKTAQLIAFLISPQFIAHYKWKPIMKAFSGANRIIPIILRSVLWKEQKELANLQPLPSNHKPISLWEDQDEAWMDVAMGISQIAAGISIAPHGNKCVWHIRIEFDHSVSSSSFQEQTAVYVVATLKIITGDKNIELSRIDYGSLVLILNSSEISFRKTETTFHNGILSKLLKIAVISVKAGDPKNPDEGGGGGGGRTIQWQPNDQQQVVGQKT